MARWIARAALIALALVLAALLRPLAPAGGPWAEIPRNVMLGALVVLLALGLELAMRAVSPWAAAGAAAGAALGGWAAASWARVLPREVPAIVPFVSLVAVYAFAIAGARLGRSLARSAFPSPHATGSSSPATRYTIVDTSVIIDGRIADVCATGFLDGTFVVPSFVLRELQHVADSSDPLRRARGRRGLETLEKLKKSPALEVLFPEEEIPEIREVDLKLIEMARRMGGKLLTNDYNLNKVASIRGVEVRNLNDLAHALRPVVLPGETLLVAILREGKEPHQGVAYLDDGTMVVVEQARSEIGRTVEVVVTSVLQTAAGKMFFGRLAGE